LTAVAAALHEGGQDQAVSTAQALAASQRTGMPTSYAWRHPGPPAEQLALAARLGLAAGEVGVTPSGPLFPDWGVPGGPGDDAQSLKAALGFPRVPGAVVVHVHRHPQNGGFRSEEHTSELQSLR